MLCISAKNNAPWFNLAAEEYLLTEHTEDIFMLWLSQPSVIVGKHQNTLAEINYDYVKNNNIKVARRLTGGGAVYHDEGNLNFTFILNGKEGRLVNFYRYMEPVLEVLRGLSLDAYFGGGNNIMINNMKISGNAEHIFKQRILHHGTLLFDAQLDRLDKALKVTTGRYSDKAVQSIRSKVDNIRGYLRQDMDIMQFREILFRNIYSGSSGSMVYELSPADTERINKLVQEKYSTWEWIFGYSPRYSLKCAYRTGRRDFKFYLFVETGIIKELKAIDDGAGDRILSGLSGIFSGMAHRESDLLAKTGAVSKLLLISEKEAYEFIRSMF
jgi:lipoate-protein ligase A